jgi:hypothetical protein
MADADDAHRISPVRQRSSLPFAAESGPMAPPVPTDVKMPSRAYNSPSYSRTAAVCALLLAVVGSADVQNCAVPADSCAGQLSAQVVIVTGASRGVGAKMARVYAREGASVVVNYFASKDKADAVVDEINSAGPGRAIAVYGDVTSAADMQVSHVKRRGEMVRVDLWHHPRVDQRVW